MGCDLCGASTYPDPPEFQSTHPYGVRRKHRFTCLWGINFNPRTRMGCDGALMDVRKGFKHFNPRTRMGCDKDVPRPEVSAAISIHAPVWGATGICQLDNSFPSHFNPRTRMGCDLSPTPRYISTAVFQSTHPYGVRRGPGAIPTPAEDFNPRTRMGCDEGHFFYEAAATISIHAPVWGATNALPSWRRCSSISIHAPAWGATDAIPPDGVELPVFQSTHPHGVRPGASWHAPYRTFHFNPRTRMGCDRMRSRPSGASTISIHAPAWGATRWSASPTSTLRISIHAPAWGATGSTIWRHP